MVSYVDKQAETMLVEALQPLWPDAGFIAEEGSGGKRTSGYNWIIDPLDGTTNFIHGLPVFSVSIALMYQQDILFGAVYEINRDEFFHAIRHEGAWLNGTKIQVSSQKDFSQSLIATGFPYVIDDLEAYLGLLRDFLSQTHGFRRMGSAAVDLSYVACGRFEGFYELNLNPWDVAAGALIVQEAGGTVSDFHGDNNFIFGREIVASNTLLHQNLLQVIWQNFKDRKKAGNTTV